MTSIDILRGLYLRTQESIRQGCRVGGALRYETDYAFRQLRGKFYRDLHVLAERKVRRGGLTDEQMAERHGEGDYPDPPDHMCIACLCGREWT